MNNTLCANVFKALVRNKKTKEVYGSTTLTDGSITTSVNTNDVRCGEGNQLIAVLHTGRDINISFSDIICKLDWIANQFGQDITLGKQIVPAMPTYYEVSMSGTIELMHTPINVESLRVYKNGVKIDNTKFELSTKTLTPIGSEWSQGDEIEVRTYDYETVDTTKSFVIDNKVFAESVELVLQTLLIDTDERPVGYLMFRFDSAIPEGNVEFKTTSEKTAQAQTFNYRILTKGNTTKVGHVYEIPLSEEELEELSDN